MDLLHAKKVFEQYLDGYDREDDKVRLKIVHTYGVAKCSRQIAERMQLPKEEQELAQLIGLLHDIGRFEQLKRFDSFEPDTMDHASFGVRILFEEGLIRNFVKEDTFDEVIRTAIAKHSDFRLQGITDDRTLRHARIIRDADKLDNCRVKLEDTIETILGVTAREVGETAISGEILEQFKRKESILSSARRTKMDYWLSYLAYFFDINYKVSMDMIRENDYIKRLIRRIPYSNPQTKVQMGEVEEMLLRYAEEFTQ
ncbi:MAG: HD domain-containing protein [Dorea sp.]|jgi:putative nucleotidyltransferase with HDIG domain|uniref:HD domain-containing protein n=1 Tax=Sporofaciens musculi TaxID=2681861 RepID=UPI00216C226C|nr:HD domain-containing protein [Sporofaciens musculi]MCI9422438.1 HD domain-containing protein [Dorea sp.]